MNIREVAEQIISAVNAGSPSISQKWNPRQVEDMLPTLRNRAIEIVYNGSRDRGMSKRIDSAWIQKFDVTVDPTIQDANAEYLIVNVPLALPISQNINGSVYVGSKDKTNKFFHAQTRDEIQTLKDRGFINTGKYIVYTEADGQMEIYGNKALKDFYVERVLADPTESPNFNAETSDYPISKNLLDIMINVFKQEFNVAIQQPKDTVLDGNPNQPR